MREWLIEAIIARLEDEIDASEGLASLAKTEGTVSLENYLAANSMIPRRPNNVQR